MLHVRLSTQLSSLCKHSHTEEAFIRVYISVEIQISLLIGINPGGMKHHLIYLCAFTCSDNAWGQCDLKCSPLGSGTSALIAISSTLHVSSKWGSRHLHSNLVGKGDILFLSSPSFHKRGFPTLYVGTQTLTAYRGSPGSTLTGSS